MRGRHLVVGWAAICAGCPAFPPEGPYADDPRPDAGEAVSIEPLAELCLVTELERSVELGLRFGGPEIPLRVRLEDAPPGVSMPEVDTRFGRVARLRLRGRPRAVGARFTARLVAEGLDRAPLAEAPLSIRLGDCPGLYDLRFGDGTSAPGLVLLPSDSRSSRGFAVTTDERGRPLVVGAVFDGPEWWAAHGTDTALWRFLDGGTLDPSFGGTGRVVLELSGMGRIDHGWCAASAAGAITVGGHAAIDLDPSVDKTGVLVAGLDERGALDPGYGAGGVTRFGQAIPAPSNFDVLLRMIPARDGGHWVAGVSQLGSERVQRGLLLGVDARGAARLDGRGRALRLLEGLRQTRLDALAWDGERFVAAGSEGAGDDCDVMLVRYTADGEPDPSFGRDGRVAFDLAAVSGAAGRSDRATDLVVTPDGHYVVAGIENARIAELRPFLARFDRDGAPAPWPATGRAVIIPDCSPAGLPGQLFALTVGADGALYAVGACGPKDGGWEFFGDSTVFAFDASGAPHAGFGDGDGKLQRSFAPDPRYPNDAALGVAVDPEGRVLVSGTLQVGEEEWRAYLLRVLGPAR